MNKNKKINIKMIGISVFIIFVMLSILIIKKPSYAYENERLADTVYGDFSDISTVDNKYSNSVLFLSSDSQIIKIKGPTPESNSNGSIGSIAINKTYKLTSESQELALLITKSAVDKDGNLLDVVITLTDVNFWSPDIKHSEDYYISLNIKSQYLFLKNQNASAWSFSSSSNNEITQSDSGYNKPSIKIGDPLEFSLDTTCADVLFSMTYYKTGVTYDTTAGTYSGELADITSVNTFLRDLDIPTTRYLQDTSTYTTSKGHKYTAAGLNKQILKGNEGIVPMNGASTIYYNKNNQKTSGKYRINLGELDNGIASVENYGTSRIKYVGTNGVWYQSSAFMLTDNIAESTLKFRYGGIRCGIGFSFLSPYPYTIPNPTKDIIDKKDEYNISENFIYKVIQYVPNMYFSQNIGFSSIYSNIKASTSFEQFIIQDELENYLSIDESKSIAVKNDNNTDVTSSFDISVENKLVTASAKTTALNNSSFYAHSYILEIPVKFNSSGVNVKTIRNTATITSKLPDLEPVINDTNEVDVDVYFNVTARYLLEGTNEVLAPNIISKKYAGDSYETEDSSEVSSRYELVAVPSNATGTISDHNITVTYYYKLIDKVAKLYKVDSETNEHVHGAELSIYDKNNVKVAKWVTNNTITSCNLAVIGNSNGCEVYSELEPNETYKVVEETTPSGYATSDPVTFTTDDIGNYSERIVISNVPIRVCISTVDKNNNILTGFKVEMREGNNNLYKTFTSTNGETCYSYVPINNYKLEETELIDNYIKPDIKNIEVIDTPEVQHFKIINNKLPKIEICMKVNNVTTATSTKKFPVQINNTNYETWMSLKHNDCESIYVNPDSYNIKEIVPQEYNLISVTGAITNNDSSLTALLDNEYKVTFTNEFTKKGFYHSDGRAENKVVVGGN